MKMESNSEKASTSGLQNSENVKRPKLTAGEDDQDKQKSSKDSKVLEQKPFANNDEISGADNDGNDKSDDQNSSADNVQKKEERKITSIKTLADLIGFCRESGIQVYNDTSNVPEADRLRMEALGEQGKVKKHSSDDKDPNLRKRSKQNKSGKTSLESDIDMETRITNSAATRLDMTSRKTSAVTSESNRSRATSRMSSVYSSNEIEGKTKDAEELLQQRMRMRSKRRRENRGTLVGLITEARKLKNESEMKLTEESDKSENPDVETKVNDRPKSALTTDNKPKLDLNQTGESKLSTHIKNELENLPSNDDIGETDENEPYNKNQTGINEDLEITINDGQSFKDENEKEINDNGNQEVTSDETTKKAEEERSSELVQNRRQEEMNEEEKESEEFKEDVEEIEKIYVIPDTDEGNITITQSQAAKSGYESNIETKRKDSNKTQESDLGNSSRKDENKVQIGDITNMYIDKSTASNDEHDESLQNMGTEDKKNTNETDATLTMKIVEDELKGCERTQLNKTDEEEFVKEDVSDRSKDDDVECNDKNDHDGHNEIGLDNTAIDKHEIRDADDRDTQANTREDKLDVPEDESSASALTDFGGTTSAHTDIGDYNPPEISFTHERSDSEILRDVADVNKPVEEQLESESEKIVEEVRIKDGKSTLVLYKVKEKSLLNMERKNVDNIEIKREVTNNDIHEESKSHSKTDIKVYNHKHSGIRKEGSEEADLDAHTRLQDENVIVVTGELSQNVTSAPTSSHNEDCNSERSIKANDRSDEIEISERPSEINTSNHDTGIDIDSNSSENKDIEKESFSKNSSDIDQTNIEILNGDKMHEESISYYKDDGEVNLSKTENVIQKETQNHTMDNKIMSNNEQELNEIGHLVEKNAIYNDQVKNDDMSVIKDEPAKHAKSKEDGELEFSEDEGNELGYVGKGKGKRETKLEPDAGIPEQTSSRNSKKGMTAEEWMHFLREMNRKKTSIESSRMLSSQARIILLMEKAKQTNEYYGKEHIKTIKLFEEARGVFSDDLEFWRGKGKGFRPRENSSDEATEIKEEQEESQTEIQDQEQAEENDEKQEHTEEPEKEIEEKEELESEATTKEAAKEVKPKKKKVKLAAPTLPKLSDERLRQIREMYWNNGQGNSETFELDGEEYFLDPNGELVKSIKFNASKKIDTRWDPGHPMFKKLQNKNKAPELKGVVQAAKSTKPTKIKANDISSSNVYVTEAKRIFPKGFEEEKISKTEVKKVKKMKSFKMKSVDIGNTGQEENNSLTRIESNDVDIPEKRKLNRNVSVPVKLGVNDNKSSEENEGEVNKRKLRKTKSVSSKLADSKIEPINENESTGAGKRLRTKAPKQNNYVEQETDLVSDTTGDASKENKTATTKKQKKLKYKKTNSSKEFEVDQAFLIDQNEFNEKTVNLDGVKITGQSNEVVLKKNSKTSPKNSLPNLEFQTQDEGSSKHNADNDHQDEGKVTSPTENERLTDGIIASRKRTFKRKSKKKRKISNDNLNAMKIFEEARADLPRDLSIINDTNEGISRNVQRAKKNPVEYSSSSSLVSGKSDMSMQTAVEIMQSRGRFYVNPRESSEKSEPREHRVYRLYKEIQTIRRNTAPLPEPSNTLAEVSRSVINDPDTGFLLLNYERRNKCFRNKNWRTQNSDVKKFLYGSIDYEVCSKVKGVNPTFRRRLKAYDFLKMKMYAR